MTNNAKIVYDIINSSYSHYTADDIYLKVKEGGKKMSFATVYNSLNSLHKEGFIHKVTLDGSPDRYDKTIRHDHLICKKCGVIKDVFLKDLTSEIEKEVKNCISYDLNISYICDNCK